MLNRRKAFALLLALGTLAQPLAAQNLIANGSFEDDTYTHLIVLTQPYSYFIAPWTIGGSIDWVGVLWQATDGARSIDLNGNYAGSISQAVPTTPGEAYLLSFDLAANPDPSCGTGTRDLNVSAAGASQVFAPSPVGNTYADMGYVEQTLSFVAVDNSTTVLFESLVGTRCGGVLDNVRVEAVVAANEPPNTDAAAPSTGSLWPPNKKMVDITIDGVTDADGDPVTITIDGITNDETGDADATFSGSTASVRADRFGKGDGRTYTIAYTATDGNGGSASGVVTVVVPHDQGHEAGDSGSTASSKTKGSGKAASMTETRSWGQIKQAQ